MLNTRRMRCGRSLLSRAWSSCILCDTPLSAANQQQHEHPDVPSQQYWDTISSTCKLLLSVLLCIGSWRPLAGSLHASECSLQTMPLNTGCTTSSKAKLPEHTRRTLREQVRRSFLRSCKRRTATAVGSFIQIGRPLRCTPRPVRLGRGAGMPFAGTARSFSNPCCLHSTHC